MFFANIISKLDYVDDTHLKNIRASDLEHMDVDRGLLKYAFKLLLK